MALGVLADIQEAFAQLAGDHFSVTLVDPPAPETQLTIDADR